MIYCDPLKKQNFYFKLKGFKIPICNQKLHLGDKKWSSSVGDDNCPELEEVSNSESSLPDLFIL